MRMKRTSSALAPVSARASDVDSGAADNTVADANAATRLRRLKVGGAVCELQ
jgi:hypothetical protein